MSEIVSVNYEALDEAIKNINSAYVNYKSIVESGFEKEVGMLDSMNSDFIDKLARVLEMLGDKMSKEVNGNIEHYVDEAQTIYDEIKRTDEALAETELSEG